ncbi:DUF1330 domain-containing protein [Saccharopolyspora phatthalungensis]|uniref:Uncharacterized protein (DUF1330 family) n=1 Tax=Saccharopolyspora phatthalungensis TaxID=664693 RepID=A0A840QC26_9PSEU|nr:DUF1330 domain-containing protein [Saccharopolyspora phatthalungensis]MBB5157330.1 uncharacterized protein (DUF1330 family) [Saccharopolyspora phatthalungensis]
MSAYLIGVRERVHDQDAYDKYLEAAPPTLPASTKFHALDGRFTVLEGAAADGVVLVEFDSYEQALEWYHSGEYRAAKNFRDGAVDYRLIVVEGL